MGNGIPVIWRFRTGSGSWRGPAGDADRPRTGLAVCFACAIVAAAPAGMGGEGSDGPAGPADAGGAVSKPLPPPTGRSDPPGAGGAEVPIAPSAASRRMRLVGAGEKVVLGADPPPPGSSKRETAGGAANRADGPCLWRQTAGPEIPLAPGKAKARSLELRPVEPGSYTFVRISGDGIEETFSFEVPPGSEPGFGNRRPVARIPAVAPAFCGCPVVLDGRMSFDPDGQALSGRWEKGEVDSEARIEPDDRRKGMTACFVAPKEGIYKVRFYASDGTLESEAATVYVRVMGMPEDDPALRPVRSDPPGPPDDPMERPATFELREGNLQKALEKFPSRTGLALIIEKEVADPREFASIPVSVALKDAPARQIADFICRQLGAAYRRAGSRAFRICGPDFLAGEKLEAKAYPADALFIERGGGDLRAILHEAMKWPMFLRNDITVEVDAGRRQIHVVAPMDVIVRIGAIVAALRGPGDPLTGAFRERPQLETLRRKLRETKVPVEWKARRLDLALRDIGERGEVNVGWNPREFAGDLPRLSLSAEGVSLADLCAETVRQAGFRGFAVHPPNAVWFY
ncbi:MAG: hypothetical protein N3A38_01590, partial [Planctomycetota bacterium]|nr:hypothetical protein [Planctomycetota bacterium]